jgi:hypothetical protein
MTRFRCSTTLQAIVSSVAALLSACASSADRPPDDPASDQPVPAGDVAKLRGVLQLAATPPDPEEIRVSLVWRVDRELAKLRRVVAQDVAVSETWPVQFTVDLVAPPDEALLTSVSGARYALANVVAYRDRNHNERLDFTAIEADDFVDELVAIDGVLALAYHEDDPEKFVLHNGRRGVTEPVSAPITLYPVEGTRTSCHLLEWMPRFALDEFTATPKPTDPWQFDEPLACPEASPPPEARGLACYGADHATYVASWTREPSAFFQDTCGPVVRMCTGSRDPSQPPPEGWPCPCDPAKHLCDQL